MKYTVLISNIKLGTEPIEGYINMNMNPKIMQHQKAMDVMLMLPTNLQCDVSSYGMFL